MLLKAKKFQEQSGLIMVQIDGFSKTELEQAMDNGEMPFLKSLIEHEKYRLHSLYPGLPSTTPSIQGELFYGVKQSVPSFFFFDKLSQKLFRMYDGDCVRAMEERLAKQGTGLLKDGSSYSNIYSGGAKETHFCASSLGWKHVWKDVNLVEFYMLVTTHLFAAIRMALLCLWETVLALWDLVYGLFKREDPVVESKFVPLRILLCILLRELVTLGAMMDAARGLPIIHLNYLGYDEQAHRRRPGSRTAHWAMKGIDTSIERIYSAALHSSRRHYDLWVYSDHGQEITIPYIGLYGKSVEEAVSAVANDPNVVVAAMGPLGGVYISKEITVEEKHHLAEQLVQEARIPLVLMPDQEGTAMVWNEKGKYMLPQQAEEVFGPDLPFFKDIVADIIALSHHPNAGTVTISGWRKDGEPLSFPFENGAHAGPGRKETDAFALLPANIKPAFQERPYLRVKDLRELALRSLGRIPALKGNWSVSSPVPDHIRSPDTIRIMTYNVHSCVGMDRKVSPERIAKVIGRYEPDIVALQELDIGRKYSGNMDQPHLIAKELEMIYHFHPSFQIEEEQYGNAILSRYPMKLVHVGQLPKINNKFNSELRGALWVSVTVGDVQLQVINTHLSLHRSEGRQQAISLMGAEWASDPRCRGPVILCGDFNCLPHSGTWRTINHKLRDVQRIRDTHRTMATWPVHYPVSRIDHIFISPGIKVTAIEVPRTKLNRLSSDHLPLFADLEVV